MDPFDFGLMGDIPGMGAGAQGNVFGMGGVGQMPAAQQPGQVLPEMAQAFAAKGIRPEDFLRSPQVAVEAAMPQALANPMRNDWTPDAANRSPMGPVVPAMGASSTDEAGMVAADPAQEAQAQASPGGGDLASKFLKGLQGVKAPAAPPQMPRPQILAAPNAYQPRGQIEGGRLMALLQAMGAGHQMPGQGMRR